MRTMNSKCIVALVPMKAHSERVPNKNIAIINGRPLYFWILNALSRSMYIKEIVVNTDSPIIAKGVLENFRVTIIDRPLALRGDMVGIQPLIEHDLSQTSGQYYLQTHSTNPLLTTKAIDESIEAYFQDQSCDSLFSVTAIKKRFFWGDKSPINHDPSILLRTQDLEPIYEENSCIYIFSRDSNEKNKNRLGSRPKMFELNPMEAVDIDVPDDFIWAEYLLVKNNA